MACWHAVSKGIVSSELSLGILPEILTLDVFRWGWGVGVGVGVGGGGILACTLLYICHNRNIPV